MFLINSCRGLDSVAALSSGSKFHHQKQRTFSRSYGTNLLTSFRRVLSSDLYYSYRPPVLVSSTFPVQLKLRGSSWNHGITHFTVRVQLAISSQHSAHRICLRRMPTTLHLDNQPQADITNSDLS